jgi:hypothetical protein
MFLYFLQNYKLYLNKFIYFFNKYHFILSNKMIFISLLFRIKKIILILQVKKIVQNEKNNYNYKLFGFY